MNPRILMDAPLLLTARSPGATPSHPSPPLRQKCGPWARTAAGRAPASSAGPLRPGVPGTKARPARTGLSHFSSSARASARALPARPGPAPPCPSCAQGSEEPARWARAAGGTRSCPGPLGGGRGLDAPPPPPPGSGPPTLGLSFHTPKRGVNAIREASE